MTVEGSMQHKNTELIHEEIPLGYNMKLGFQNMLGEQDYNLQHQTCFQSLTKNAHLSSVFNSTELSVEKIFLSSDDLADDMITSGLPSPTKKPRSEDASHSYVVNTENTYFPCTGFNEKIRDRNKTIIKPITAVDLGVSCLPSTGKNNENNRKWSNKNNQSGLEENNSMKEMKTQVDLSKCSLPTAPKPWFINTLINFSVTTKNEYKYTESADKRNPILGASQKKVSYYKLSNESLISTEMSDILNFWGKCNPVIEYSRNDLMASPSKPHQEFYFNQDRHNIPTSLTMSVEQDELAVKDTILFPVLFGKTPGVFTHRFTLQSHSPLDYIITCSDSQTEKQPANQVFYNETRCCGTSRDDMKDLSAGTSLLGHASPSAGVLKKFLSIRQDEPLQKCNVLYGRNDMTNSYENKNSISANVVANSPTCHVLQKSDLSLPYIHKKTGLFCLFDNNDESFQSRENAFLAQLNYFRRTGERHSVHDMELSMSAASLLGTAKNEFSCFSRNSSRKNAISETVSKFCDNSMKTKETEEENLVTSCEILDVINGNLCFLPKKALGKHYEEVGRTEHFQKYVFSSCLGYSKVRECGTHDSFTENFEKISPVQNLQDYGCDDHQIHDILRKENMPTHDNVVIFKNTTSTRQLKCNNSESQDSQCGNALPETQNTSSEGEVLRVETDCGCFSNNLEMPYEMSREVSSQRAGNNNWLEVQQYPEDSFREASAMYEASETVDVDNVSDTEDIAGILPLSKDSLKNNLCSINGTKEELINIERFSDETFHLYSISGTNPLDGDSSGPHSTSDAADGYSKGDSRERLVKFEMKAQFDLVLEELALFHTIGERDDCEPKDTCFHIKKSPEMYNNDFADSSAKIPESKIEFKASCREHNPIQQERLRSTVKKEELTNNSSWTPVFPSNGRMEVTEKGCTFMLGIGRVTPLKTRTGPLRLGLSKRAKLKQLHPYLR